MTTTEALRMLRGRGLIVSYPTVARWVQNGLSVGAERVEETKFNQDIIHTEGD